jgi:hypothetical protein
MYLQYVVYGAVFLLLVTICELTLVFTKSPELVTKIIQLSQKLNSVHPVKGLKKLSDQLSLIAWLIFWPVLMVCWFALLLRGKTFLMWLYESRARKLKQWEREAAGQDKLTP